MPRKSHGASYEAGLAYGRDYYAKRKQDSAFKQLHRQRALDWKKTNPEQAKASRFRASLKQYGIDFLTYSALLIVQSGRCANSRCNIPMAEPHIDHDHVDNKVRGLLCHQCNLVVGFAKDSIPKLVGAIDYLQRFNAR